MLSGHKAVRCDAKLLALLASGPFDGGYETGETAFGAPIRYLSSAAFLVQ